MDPNRRRARLLAALGFARLELQPEPPALAALKGWLGSWSGIGAVITGQRGPRSAARRSGRLCDGSVSRR